MTNPSVTPGAVSAALAAIRANSGIFLAEGIILIILGVLAILLPVIATLAIAILLGWLFLISGIIGLVTSFWAREAPGFWWAVLSAVLAIVAGGILLISPVQGAISLTFVLIAFFILQGIATIMFAIEHRRELSERWAWMLVSGIITLALAVIIFMGLPGTAAWTLGLLAGIDLVFGGVALTGIALAARRQA